MLAYNVSCTLMCKSFVKINLYYCYSSKPKEMNGSSCAGLSSSNIYQYLFPYLECSLSYPSIIPSLCFLLIDHGILIRCKSKLIQFIQLHQPVLSCKLRIKVEKLKSPKGSKIPKITLKGGEQCVSQNIKPF